MHSCAYFKPGSSHKYFLPSSVEAYQRPTASYPGDREKVLAGDAAYSGPEHGLFRCTADTNTDWTAESLEIGGVTYNPPLQGRNCCRRIATRHCLPSKQRMLTA